MDRDDMTGDPHGHCHEDGCSDCCDDGCESGCESGCEHGCEHGDASNQPPYVMAVYFKDLPEIDCAQLEEFLNSCDSEEQDKCKVQPLPEQNADGISIHGFAISMGDFFLGVLLHSVPDPDLESLLEMPMEDDTRQELAEHKAFALLNCLGGEEYIGYERMIFLYKTALGLCRQGALGVGVSPLGWFVPAPVLSRIDQETQVDHEGQPYSLWRLIREEHEPFPLLAEIGQIEINDSRWMVTRGFAFCGFPDLVYKLVDGDDPDEIADLMRGIFDYLMENGPVIGPGHTFGEDEQAQWAFDEVPEDLVLPFESWDMIQLRRATADEA